MHSKIKEAITTQPGRWQVYVEGADAEIDLWCIYG